MATPALSNDTALIEAALENLERMLPHWREKLRHESQFWPQFDALAAEIRAKAGPALQDMVDQRLAGMLAAHGLRRL